MEVTQTGPTRQGCCLYQALARAAVQRPATVLLEPVDGAASSASCAAAFLTRLATRLALVIAINEPPSKKGMLPPA